MGKKKRPERCAVKGCVFPAIYVEGESEPLCLNHRRERDPYNAFRFFRSETSTARICNDLSRDGVVVADLPRLLRQRFCSPLGPDGRPNKQAQKGNGSTMSHR
jgi:hypothetical protein